MYQVTSDVNVVNPGGAAQNPTSRLPPRFHVRATVAAKFRAHVHRLTPALTLQGAVAHVDMPAETGPDQVSAVLAAIRIRIPRVSSGPEFKEFFEANYVQLPLKKGDAVFFNPALFHAAGHNKSSDVLRMANLLQVSSAFGRALGTIDREALVNAIYPHCSPSAKQVPTSPFAVPSPPRPRATPSRPIWTETNRSTASRLRRRPN